jgi:Rho termination factor, N-terminal domain
MATRNNAPSTGQRSLGQRSSGQRSFGQNSAGQNSAGQNSAGPGRSNRRATARGGIDTNTTKVHLMDVARQMDISGRSRMSKPELVNAIRKTDNRSTQAVRRRSFGS